MKLSQKEKNIYEHIYVASIKMVQVNIFAKQNRDTDIENKRMDTKQAKGGWDELGDWN